MAHTCRRAPSGEATIRARQPSGPSTHNGREAHALPKNSVAGGKFLVFSATGSAGDRQTSRKQTERRWAASLLLLVPSEQRPIEATVAEPSQPRQVYCATPLFFVIPTVRDYRL